MALHFDVMEIEMGDLDIYEAITGKRFDPSSLNAPNGAADMKALYYLVMRQNDAEFTPDKLAKVKIRQLVDMSEAIKTAMPDPTSGGGVS